MENESLSVGDVVEVGTERLAYGGEAVARHGRLVIFVPLAAPGEVLRVRVVERKKNFARGVIQEIVSPSPARREPPCPYFGDCGGCQLQHIAYPVQLEQKAGFVRDALTRIGGIEWPGELRVRAAEEFGYRARAQVKIEWARHADESASGQASSDETGPGDPGSAARIGFNRSGSRSVCDVKSCPILLPELNRALDLLRAGILANAAASSQAGRLTGLREIEMASGDDGVSFEPSPPGLPHGPISRRIAGISYRFSPATFFQANPLLIEELIATAIGNQAGELAVDLYAGVGLFTLQLAKRFDRVIGVESEPRAAKFARENASGCRAANVEFHTERSGPWLEGYAGKDRRRPDLILLDPPRGGASEVIAHIARVRPRSLVYISCDPATLARDLKYLINDRYKINEVSAFDLFPQTYHVETVVQLETATG